MTPRIVSLLPSATEIVCALGLGPYLVGRSHQCDFPAEVEALPACTRSQIDSSGSSAEIHASVSAVFQDRISVYDVDDVLLRELQPTHIVTQVQCEVCAVSLHDVHQSLRGWPGTPPAVISLRAMTLSGVFRDMLDVARPFGAEAQAYELIHRFEERANAIAAVSRTLVRRRVVGIEWLDPLMGTGNWMPELIELAGGAELFGQPGQHARWTTWESVRAAEPDAIILFPCGFPLAKTEREMDSWNGLDSPAAVFLADGSQFFNRPGPRLLETLEILAEMLHPEHFAFGYGDIAWRRWSAINFASR